MRKLAIAVGLATVAVLAGGVDADAGGRPLDAELLGANEVPGPGDPDGEGTASINVNIGREELCYELTVVDIAPATAAHVHIGAAGDFGPVVIGLAPPTTGSSSGCASADRDLLRAIVQDPASYYVNVHNADFRGGALRGQLG